MISDGVVFYHPGSEIGNAETMDVLMPTSVPALRVPARKSHSFPGAPHPSQRLAWVLGAPAHNALRVKSCSAFTFTYHHYSLVT